LQHFWIIVIAINKKQEHIQIPHNLNNIFECIQSEDNVIRPKTDAKQNGGCHTVLVSQITIHFK